MRRREGFVSFRKELDLLGVQVPETDEPPSTGNARDETHMRGYNFVYCLFARWIVDRANATGSESTMASTSHCR